MEDTLGMSVCVSAAALNGSGNATVLVDQEQRWGGQGTLRPRPSWPTAEVPLGATVAQETWALGPSALCMDWNETRQGWDNSTQLYREPGLSAVGDRRNSHSDCAVPM